MPSRSEYSIATKSTEQYQQFLLLRRSRSYSIIRLPFWILLDPSMSAISIPLWQYAEEDSDGVERAEQILKREASRSPEKLQSVTIPKLHIKLTVVSMCNGIGVPLIALHHSLKLMKVQGHEFSIINSVVIEHNEDAAKLNESTLQQHGYPGNIFAIKKMEDLSQWILEHLCENSGVPWKDTMLLVMTGTPCKSISYGCKANKNRTQFGIHASPSNVWFLAHSAIFQLCQIFSPADRIIMVENVVPPNADDLRTLDEMAGFRQNMSSPTNHGGTRNRYAWTSIPIDKDCPTIYNFNFLDIIKMPGTFVFQTHRKFPVLRAIFPKLIEEYTQEPCTLSQQDRQTISDCYVLHQESNEPILPPLALWAVQMGMDNKMLQAWQSVFPCMAEIQVYSSSTGTRKEKCGICTYCHSCSTIISHLGEAWNLKTTTTTLFQLLFTFCKNRQGPTDQDITRQFDIMSFQYNYVPHTCSIFCDKVRSNLL